MGKRIPRNPDQPRMPPREPWRLELHQSPQFKKQGEVATAEKVPLTAKPSTCRVALGRATGTIQPARKGRSRHASRLSCISADRGPASHQVSHYKSTLKYQVVSLGRVDVRAGEVRRYLWTELLTMTSQAQAPHLLLCIQAGVFIGYREGGLRLGAARGRGPLSKGRDPQALAILFVVPKGHMHCKWALAQTEQLECRLDLWSIWARY